ncbi:MAG: hypothetical protein JJU26_12225 [Oceanicaulis sp.]|uniref:hypothetical protein n=1 Tax=Glycocaulis sp. TaxID=1969725 RepID=UPI0025BD2890|nr:hypothetical protein [Glycocaulis sp.]MCC5982472.1 hypothetical protein [Oceanicaulis sp.]MCH8521174.1 hypothetical protein [Glycocaulis sp.]
MEPQRASFLNTAAATGLGLSAAILAYAGFDRLFDNATLAALSGALIGGFIMGRLLLRRPEAGHRA